jgi:hypothetical protein
MFVYRLAGAFPAQLGSLIVSAKMNHIDPQAWLAHVLANVGKHMISRLDELLPWNWRTPDTLTQKAA